MTLPVPMGSKDETRHAVSVRGVWCGDGSADVRVECDSCDWFIDLRYPAAADWITALADGHRQSAAVLAAGAPDLAP